MKAEFIYGLHPILEALKANKRIFYALYGAVGRRRARIEPILALARERGLALQTRKAQELQAFAGTAEHQGLVARVSPFACVSLSELLQGSIEAAAPALLVLLDSIVDPHNLGALVRSAHCVGALGVVIPKDRAASPSPVVSKISGGALEHMALAKVTNLAHSMRRLKQAAFWITGMDIRAQRSLYDADLSGPLALVLGNEAKGLRPLIRRQCDYLLSIPQVGQIDSLNTSVAGAVALYEAFRQRRYGPKEGAEASAKY